MGFYKMESNGHPLESTNSVAVSQSLGVAVLIDSVCVPALPAVHCTLLQRRAASAEAINGLEKF